MSMTARWVVVVDTQLREFRQQIDDLKGELDGTRAQLDEARDELAAVREQLDELRCEQLDAEDAAFSTIRATANQLRNEIENQGVT